jgi:BRCT domain type II-containing protein
MKNIVSVFVLLLGALALHAVSTPVDARGGARSSVSGGGRASAQPRQASGSRAAAQPADANRTSASANRSNTRSTSSSTSRSTSRDVSREVSRDVDIDVDDGCCFGNVDNPLAATMVVAGTAAAIGSMVSTPPPNCVPVAVGGITYQQCGSTWYQPQMNGSSTTYVVVSPPH